MLANNIAVDAVSVTPVIISNAFIDAGIFYVSNATDSILFFLPSNRYRYDEVLHKYINDHSY
jgi:hypothetical protein